MNPPKPCCDKHGLFCKSISESGKYCEETGEQFSYRMEDVHEWARQLADDANDIVDFSPPFYPACKETDKLCKGCQDDLQRIYDKVRALEKELLSVAGDEKT